MYLGKWISVSPRFSETVSPAVFSIQYPPVRRLNCLAVRLLPKRTRVCRPHSNKKSPIAHSHTPPRHLGPFVPSRTRIEQAAAIITLFTNILLKHQREEKVTRDEVPLHAEDFTRFTTFSTLKDISLTLNTLAGISVASLPQELT